MQVMSFNNFNKFMIQQLKVKEIRRIIVVVIIIVIMKNKQKRIDKI